MALYHFHVAQIGRAKGFSSVAAAAYRSGEELYDDYYGETHDYTKKGGVLYTEIMMPDYAPERFKNRGILWNEVEKIEKHPKAQLCYSFDIALQNELSFDENLELARQFVSEELVKKGMICDLAIHEPDKGDGGINNPHFHVICPIRPYTEDDEWGEKQRREYVLDDNGERIRNAQGKYVFNAVPTTDWGRPETLDLWRAHWADMVNAKFEEKGLDCHIDQRSYADRGVDLIPQVHEGSAVRRMEARGIVTTKGDHNRFILATNRMIRDIISKLKGLAEWYRNSKAELEQYRNKHLDTLILEYFDYRDKVAETYPRGIQKAKLSNLKIKAQVISYLHGYHLDTPEKLEARIEDLSHSADFAWRKINNLKESISRNGDRVKYCKMLTETRDIYEQSQKIFFPGVRKRFQNEHQNELKRYHVAERYFSKQGLTGDPEDFFARWQNALEMDKTKLQEEYDSLKPINEELRQLKEIRNAIDYALAKRNGEDPAMPSLRIHDRASEAFQRASGRKSLKEELTKSKEKSHEQANRSHSGIEVSRMKHRGMEIE